MKIRPRAEVTGSLGQYYAVAKQPGDSTKEPLQGRFPSLCEGISEYSHLGCDHGNNLADYGEDGRFRAVSVIFFFLSSFPFGIHFIYSAIMYLYFMEYAEC